MYRICRKIDGKNIFIYPNDEHTKKSAQESLKCILMVDFCSNDNMIYLDKPLPGFKYSEMGWYYLGTGNLICSQSEIDSPDFDHYSFDNYTEYIEEI